MWNAAATTGPRQLVLRITSTALVAGALLVPAVGRSDVDHKGPHRPTTLEIVVASSTSLTLTWSAGHGRDAHGFALFRDGITWRRPPRRATRSRDFPAPRPTRSGSRHSTRLETTPGACRSSQRHMCVRHRHRHPHRPHLRSLCTPEPPVQPPVQPSPSTAPPALPSAPAPEPRVPGALPEPGTAAAEMSWAGAGAFVWHETDVAPEALGSQLRAGGFSWVAVLIHDGLEVDPIEGDWVQRFRAASGLQVGGWGVLRTEPEREADLAHQLLDLYSLDFYIANPEAEYKFSSDDGPSRERFGRSQRFVEWFRALEPDTPAAISSYCRADRQDIDWRAWSGSGFVFLPQAYSTTSGARRHRRRVRREPPASSPTMRCTRRSGCTRARRRAESGALRRSSR